MSVKKLLKKLLFVFYLLAATTLLLEIAVRLSGYSEHNFYDPIYVPFAQAEEIPYVHKPGLSNARARGLALINTDSLGLRAKTSGERYGAHRDKEYRIAVVGDSVTFGEGVERTEDSFPQVLEDTLNGRQQDVKVKVFNFAASAYSVKVMAATLSFRMLEVEPDLVIMAVVPADFNLSRTPSVDAYGYLTDNRLSGFLSSDSRAWLLLRRIHLLYLVRDYVNPMLDKGPQAEEILERGGLPQSYVYIEQFAKTAAQHNLVCKIVLLPSLISKFGNVPVQMSRDGLPLVDLSSLRDEFTREQFRASRFDSHPSAAVHRRIGEALAAYILDARLLTSKS